MSTESCFSIANDLYVEAISCVTVRSVVKFIVSVFLCLRCCSYIRWGCRNNCCVACFFTDCCCHNNGHGIGCRVGHLITFCLLFNCSLSAIALSIDTTKKFLLKHIKYPVCHHSSQLVVVPLEIGALGIGERGHWEFMLLGIGGWGLGDDNQ